MSRPAPRSIDDYLSALRAALDGADPALIQDAVYDAEEYLRAEVAANPGVPEAEVLERLLKTYGSPEEIAIGFIGIARAISLGEGRLLEAVSGERMPRRPVHPGSGSLWERILAMLQDGRTWTTVAYLVMMLPLGVIYSSVALTGLAVGVSFLLVPLVGIAQRSEWWVSQNTGPLVFSPWWLDTPMGWVFCAVFGAVVLTSLLHFARFVVRMHARAAKALLVT
jgi:hypothetical protein